jgi:opacity protein-like surface antigen
MRSFAVRCAVSLALLAALAPSARADDPSVSSDRDKARYELAAYLWGMSLAAKVDTNRGSISEHVSFHDLLQHLSGGVMAHGRGEWDTESGTWSADVDGLWAKLRGKNQSETVRLGPQGGIQVGATAKTQLDMWLVQATGGYRLFKLGSMFSRSPTDPRHVTGEMYVGGRFWSIDPKINVAVNNRSARIGDRKDWVDPLVGLRFGIDLSKTVVMRIGGDVGGFNIGNYCSEFTWSQTTMLSWAFSENWGAQFGYRFLDVHRDEGNANYHVQVRGPFLATSYSF